MAKVNTVFLRTAYNYDRNEASDESGLSCPEPTRTKQAFKEECDINTIVRRFGITGQLPTGVRMPTYGDFTGLSNYHEALNAIAQANEAFDEMPAHVRARFHNNPAEFVDFCSNPDNHKEALKLGLLAPQAADLAAGANLATPPATPVATSTTTPPTGGSTTPAPGSAQSST